MTRRLLTNEKRLLTNEKSLPSVVIRLKKLSEKLHFSVKCKFRCRVKCKITFL